MAAITEPAPALKAALERQRTRFNTMFMQAKQSRSQLDASAFMEHLRNTIEPIIERIRESEPSAVDKSLAVLYETSLQLMASNLLFNTSKYRAIDYGWKKSFPTLLICSVNHRSTSFAQLQTRYIISTSQKVLITEAGAAS